MMEQCSPQPMVVELHAPSHDDYGHPSCLEIGELFW